MAEPVPSVNVSPAVPLEVTLPEPPASVTQTTTGTTTTVRTDVAPGWLHAQVRNIILLGVTGAVIYLGIMGVQEARSALFTTFISLASYLFAERAALARPGETK